MQTAKFGFTEGLTVASSDVAYLYFDLDVELYLNVDLTANKYIVYTTYPFPCTHLRIHPRDGESFTVKVDLFGPQQFSFSVPPYIGPFMISPD